MYEMCYALLLGNNVSTLEDNLGIPKAMSEGLNVEDTSSFLLHLVASEADNNNLFAEEVLNRLTQYLGVELAACPAGQHGKSMCKALASILKFVKTKNKNDRAVLANVLSAITIAEDNCTESANTTQIMKVRKTVEELIAACPEEDHKKHDRTSEQHDNDENIGISETLPVQHETTVMPLCRLKSIIDARGLQIQKIPNAKKVTSSSNRKKNVSRKFKRNDHEDSESDDEFEVNRDSSAATSTSNRPRRKATTNAKAIVDDDSDVDVKSDCASENEIEDSCSVCGKNDDADKVRFDICFIPDI
jgi:hypothetical protein